MAQEEESSGEDGGAAVAWELGSFLGQDPPLLAVQQLLIKGLFKPETEIATVEAWARRQYVCMQLRSSAALLPKCSTHAS